jgi:hypothetical protein
VIYRSRLEALAEHQPRTKRSANSPDRQLIDPCLLCGRDRESTSVQQPEKKEEAQSTDAGDVGAQLRELECPASPTDPPLHAGVRPPSPPVAELAGLGLAEAHGGEMAAHGHLLGPDQHKHEDMFGMHKPLWM